jgi:hypothetical protein
MKRPRPLELRDVRGVDFGQRRIPRRARIPEGQRPVCTGVLRRPRSLRLRPRDGANGADYGDNGDNGDLPLHVVTSSAWHASVEAARKNPRQSLWKRISYHAGTKTGVRNRLPKPKRSGVSTLRLHAVMPGDANATPVVTG